MIYFFQRRWHMEKRSILQLYDEDDILLVLDYLDEQIRLNIATNKEYKLHIEWLMKGNIRNNIKQFEYLLEFLTKGDMIL